MEQHVMTISRSDRAPSAQHRKAGRPRSEASQTAVLTATKGLLERSLVRDISIEAISRESGVAKATIYRWWDSKLTLIIDAFLDEISVTTPFLEKQNYLESISDQVRGLVRQYGGPDGEVLRQIIAECQADPDGLKLFFQRFLAPRREAARVAVKKAKSHGEIDLDIPDSSIIDVIYGPIYYRLMLQHAALDNVFADELLKFVAKALSSKGASGKNRRRPEAD
jgi:AcrR family transcriptional regulator